jgi:hypothetical protein
MRSGGHAWTRIGAHQEIGRAIRSDVSHVTCELDEEVRGRAECGGDGQLGFALEKGISVPQDKAETMVETYGPCWVCAWEMGRAWEWTRPRRRAGSRMPRSGMRIVKQSLALEKGAAPLERVQLDGRGVEGCLAGAIWPAGELGARPRPERALCVGNARGEQRSDGAHYGPPLPDESHVWRCGLWFVVGIPDAARPAELGCGPSWSCDRVLALGKGRRHVRHGSTFMV